MIVYVGKFVVGVVYEINCLLIGLVVVWVEFGND